MREPSVADLVGLDADVAGRLGVELLLLRAHDRLQRRVARLVDRVADGDHGGQLRPRRCRSRTRPGARSVSLPSSTSILITWVSDGIFRWSATTAPIV